jgi:hypothetical protein
LCCGQFSAKNISKSTDQGDLGTMENYVENDWFMITIIWPISIKHPATIFQREDLTKLSRRLAQRVKVVKMACPLSGQDGLSNVHSCSFAKPQFRKLWLHGKLIWINSIEVAQTIILRC